jgi:hypothetical protein
VCWSPIVWPLEIMITNILNSNGDAVIGTFRVEGGGWITKSWIRKGGRVRWGSFVMLSFGSSELCMDISGLMFTRAIEQSGFCSFPLDFLPSQQHLLVMQMSSRYMSHTPCASWIYLISKHIMNALWTDVLSLLNLILLHRKGGCNWCRSFSIPAFGSREFCVGNGLTFWATARVVEYGHLHSFPLSFLSK